MNLRDDIAKIVQKHENLATPEYVADRILEKLRPAPLVWVNIGNGLMSKQIPYQILSDNGGSGATDDPLAVYFNYRAFEPIGMTPVGGDHETIEEAKAAAEAHHIAAWRKAGGLDD